MIELPAFGMTWAEFANDLNVNQVFPIVAGLFGLSLACDLIWAGVLWMVAGGKSK